MTGIRMSQYWGPPDLPKKTHLFSGGDPHRRMFGASKTPLPSSEDLGVLAEIMTSPRVAQELPPGDHGPEANPTIPAGYTYFAQFLDHDVSFSDQPDGVSKIPGITETRTMLLDLDSLYGGGPEESPPLYGAETGRDDGVKLKVGERIQGKSPPHVDLARLPSNPTQAILVDPRNDENLIIAQIHAAFVAFHNKTIDVVRSDNKTIGANELFERAARITRWHYQWLVLWDLLPRLCGSVAVVRSALAIDAAGRPNPPLRYYGTPLGPYIPAEFNYAVYRCGHSMIRSSYFVNSTTITQLQFGRAPLAAYPEEVQAESLVGMRPIPGLWGLGWQFFFSFTMKPSRAASVGGGDLDGPQQSQLIDHRMTHRLTALPGKPGTTLIRTDLDRGVQMQLATGQEIADAIGVPRLDAGKLQPLGLSTTNDPIEVPATLLTDTPLLYYVLMEAEAESAGRHLGPVGRAVVLETVIGLLWQDRDSILHADPAWRPYAGRWTGQPYTMSHFIDYALELGLKPDGPWLDDLPLMP